MSNEPEMDASLLYRRWTDLIRRYRQLGLTIPDLVPVLNEPSGTISSRLNGYSPFPLEMRARLDAFLKEREKG